MNKENITEEMIKEYKANLYNDEKSKNTIDKYMRDIHYFYKFAIGKEVNKQLVIEYKNKIKDEYALTSVNSMIASINSFFRYINRYDCCIKQFKIQKKTYVSEERELSKEEYCSLIKTARESKNERLALIIQTICVTGIRISELQYITVEAIKKGETVVSCKNKTRKIFIVSKLCKMLLVYARKCGINEGAIFVTRKGNPIDRSNIWREMKQLCEQAGVSSNKVFPHNLRHLFARTFYKIEKDIAKLADILGHTNINTTRIYIISTGLEHKKKLESMKLII